MPPLEARWRLTKIPRHYFRRNRMNAQPPAAILTAEELQIPRSAAGMLTWIDEAHRRFNTKELKAEARAGNHFSSDLILEARPMALFAHRQLSRSHWTDCSPRAL